MESANKICDINSINIEDPLLLQYFNFLPNEDNKKSIFKKCISNRCGKVIPKNNFNRKFKEILTTKELEKILEYNYNDALKEALYCYLHDISEKKSLCKCGNKRTFINFTQGYHKTCGLCEFTKINKEKSRKKTNLQKYGVDHPRKNKEINNLINEKIEQTNLERYNTKSHFNSQEIKNKIKQTNLERYGVEYITQNQEIKNKIKQTNLERYGSISPLQNEAIQNKSKKTKKIRYDNENFTNRLKFKKTCLSKYGVDSPLKSQEIREKIKKTNLEKYGVEYPIQSLEVKNKLKSSFLYKYNVEHFNQLLFNNLENYNEVFIKNNFVKDGFFLQEECMQYFNRKSMFGFREKFNIKEPKKINFLKTQNEIYKFINEIVPNETVIFNDKKTLNTKDIDIYIPGRKIGIEYNGLMFHSSGISKYRMFNNPLNDYGIYNKTIECDEKGIQLFHIFENEWLNPIKKEIWKSMIKSALYKLDKTIYARKCTIKEISASEARIFLDNNHMQDNINGSIRIGLYYNNELVSIMVFGKNRFKNGVELYRFCNKIYTNIPGAFSRLLKFAINNYNISSITSYANKRWSQGNVYEKNNFIKSHETKPNYFYFHKNGGKLYNRMKFQKHKLENYLEKYDKNLSESNNMFNNGYRKIYDSGNIVYNYNILELKDGDNDEV